MSKLKDICLSKSQSYLLRNDNNTKHVDPTRHFANVDVTITQVIGYQTNKTIAEEFFV